MSDSLRLATELCEKLLACDTMQKLDVVRSEVRAAFEKDPAFKKEWASWLIDIRDGCLLDIKRSRPSTRESFNSAGQKAWDRGEI